MALIPEGSSWKNECPARCLIPVMFYRPITSTKKVKCPVLVIMAKNDSIISPKAVKKAASRMRNARLVQLPSGHFDIYSGEMFEKIVQLEAG